MEHSLNLRLVGNESDSTPWRWHGVFCFFNQIWQCPIKKGAGAVKIRISRRFWCYALIKKSDDLLTHFEVLFAGKLTFIIRFATCFQENISTMHWHSYTWFYFLQISWMNPILPHFCKERTFFYCFAERNIHLLQMTLPTLSCVSLFIHCLTKIPLKSFYCLWSIFVRIIFPYILISFKYI